MILLEITVLTFCIVAGSSVDVQGQARYGQGAVRAPSPAESPRAETHESVKEPRQAFPFPGVPSGILASERGLDSVRVRFGDGRPGESYPVNRSPEGAYLGLGDLARLLGRGFKWNPETYRGSFYVDSTAVSFVLDGPFFWVRGEAIQSPAPVRYAAESVMIPLSVLDGIVLPLLGERCRWEPSTGRLSLSGPPPWLETLEVGGSRVQANLTLAPAESKSARFRWDPLGRLSIELKGTRLPPEFRMPSGRVEGLQVQEVVPTLDGMAVILDLSASWTGVRIRSGRSGRVLLVEFTQQKREVERGRFAALRAYLPPAPSAPSTGPGGRKVILDLLPPRDPAQSVDPRLRALAENLRDVLEKDFGRQTVVVEDRNEAGRLKSPEGLPETPAIPLGDCLVGLRLETYAAPGAREFLLVTPGPVVRWEPLPLAMGAGPDPGGAATPGERSGQARDEWEMEGGGFSRLATFRMLPYGQAPRYAERASTSLAKTIAEHLGLEWAGRPVRVASRPARIFRGVAVPAVLIYPAQASDTEALDRLSDPAQGEELARNIAFALDEFLAGLAVEP